VLVSWNGVGLKAACLGLNSTINPLDTSAGTVTVAAVSLTTVDAGVVATAYPGGIETREALAFERDRAAHRAAAR
jgi:hypothetical protein